MAATITQVDQAVNYVSTGGQQGPKHQGVTSNGVLWKALWTNSNLAFFSSTNGGNSWTWQGSQTQIFDQQITHGGAFSFVIDSDDYIHLMYERYTGGGDGRTTASVITYRRATLSADKASISSWIAQQELTGSDYWHTPDIVAIKMPGTNITWLHVTWSYNWSGDNRQILVYSRLKWTGGSFTLDSGVQFLHDVTGAGITHVRPSIAFRHAGDGKTPALVGGNYKPDVWITYSLGYALRFVNIAYATATSTWSAPTLELLDSTYSNFGGTTGAINYYIYEQHRWQRLMYDANTGKIVLIGQFINQALNAAYALVFERSADSPGAANWTRYTIPTNVQINTGDACLDASGDIYVVGVLGTEWAPPNSPFKLWKISRAGSTRPLTFIETLDTTTNEARGNMLQYPSTVLHVLWTDNNANPYPIKLARYPLSNVYIHNGSALVQKTRYVWTGSAWKEHLVQKF